MGNANSSAVTMSVDMCAVCMSLFPTAYNQARMRSAGSRGMRAFNQAADAVAIAMYAENFEEINDDVSEEERIKKKINDAPAYETRKFVADSRFPVCMKHLHIRKSSFIGLTSDYVAVVVNWNLLPLEFEGSGMVADVGGVLSDVRIKAMKVTGLNDSTNGEIKHNTRRIFFIFACDFMRYYPAKSIEFVGGLGLLTRIEDNFMEHCYLETIDLTGLNALVSIGANFMHQCFELRSARLTGMTSLHLLGENFMNSNFKLESVSMDGLIHLKCINNNFLKGCDKLQNLKMEGLGRVEEIQDSFLCMCSSLSSVTLGNLSNLRSIGREFAWHCLCLGEIHMVSRLGTTTTTTVTTLKESVVDPSII